MEKTVNATLHNLVDIATDKLFSNPAVEHAKEKYYDAKDKFYDAKDRFTAKYVNRSNNDNTLLYAGLAIAAAAGAAYLIYKNREAIKEQFFNFVEQVKEMKEQYGNEQGNNSQA
jgi:hypothetical protein